jgi:AcrR family transcriptional regulator
MTSGGLERPVRSDARRNRLALTDSATAAFRDEGLDVAVDEIARRAGVGVATLYRHFPAKTDLILAVMEAVVEELGEAASLAIAQARPDEVLERFLAAALDQQRRNRGFLEAISQFGLDAAVRERLTERLVTLLEPVVVIGHDTGTLRTDLDAVDLLVAVRMLGATFTSPTLDPRPGDRDRYLAVVLRGLSATG